MLEVPGHAIVHPTNARLPLDTIYEVVRRSRPKDYIESFSSASERDSFGTTPDKALNFRSYSPQNERIQTFIDPYTGVILRQYNYNHRFLQKIYDLHDDLLGGLTGRKINAWFAILLLIVSTAGLLLWWRGRKYWRLGLEYRARASWKRQAWDIHNLVGFFFSTVAHFGRHWNLLLLRKPVRKSCRVPDTWADLHSHAAIFSGWRKMASSGRYFTQSDQAAQTVSRLFSTSQKLQPIVFTFVCVVPTIRMPSALPISMSILLPPGQHSWTGFIRSLQECA